MKTSAIEVDDMLSVLSVLGVEEQIGSVPGVESVTVNYAAKRATVRYDETRLDVADIKSAVRQRAYQSEGASPLAPVGEPTPAAPAAHGQQGKAEPKDAGDGAAAASSLPGPAADGQVDKAASTNGAQAAPPGPAGASPKPGPGGAPVATTADGAADKAAPAGAPKPSPAAPAASKSHN